MKDNYRTLFTQHYEDPVVRVVTASDELKLLTGIELAEVSEKANQGEHPHPFDFQIIVNGKQAFAQKDYEKAIQATRVKPKNIDDALAIAQTAVYLRSITPNETFVLLPRGGKLAGTEGLIGIPSEVIAKMRSPQVTRMEHGYRVIQDGFLIGKIGPHYKSVIDKPEFSRFEVLVTDHSVTIKTQPILAIATSVPQRSNPPFALKLQQVGGALRLGLVSRSDYTETYLIHGLIQPTVLVIKGAAGRAIKAFDNRSLKDFNPNPTRDSFQNLAPREERIVGDAKPEKVPNGHYNISWGSFYYRDLKSGRYELHAEWESKYSQPYAPDEGERLFPDWIGKLTSNSITLTLQ